MPSGYRALAGLTLSSGAINAGLPMTGIQFIVNERGEKTAAVIDLKKHRAAWEDFQDVVTARERRDEPRESLDEVRQRLAERGKLRDG